MQNVIFFFAKDHLFSIEYKVSGIRMKIAPEPNSLPMLVQWLNLFPKLHLPKTIKPYITILIIMMEFCIANN